MCNIQKNYSLSFPKKEICKKHKFGLLD